MIQGNKVRFLAYLLTLFFSPSTLRSYENEATHPFMIDESIGLIARSPQGTLYAEITQFNKRLSEGARDEDSPVSNVLDHFYNPVRGTGLKLSPTSKPFDSAIDKGSRIWTEALTSYIQAGQYQDVERKHNSYAKLGRVLHLIIQDMAQPQHVHDDPHTWGLIAGDGSSLEPIGQTMVRSGQFPIGTTILGTEFNHPSSFGFRIANDVYDGSLFLGVKNGHPSNVQEGDKLQLYLGSSIIGTATYVDDVMVGDEIIERAHWHLNGKNRNLFYYPHIVGDGLAVFEAKKQQFWELPEKPGSYYIDPQEDNTNEIIINGQPLEKYFIQTFAPIGINYGAGLLKLFHDIVNEPPYIKDITITDDKGTIYTSMVSPGTSASFSRNKNEQKLGQFRFDKPYTVKVTFSEPVENVKFILGNALVTPASGNESASDDKGNWSGSFIFEKSASANSCNSEITLNISAKDKHNHFGMDGGAGIDPNPATVARRETSAPYNWIDYESGDEVSKFNAPCICDSDKPDNTPPEISFDKPAGACVNTINNKTVCGSVMDQCSLPSLTMTGAGTLSITSTDTANNIIKFCVLELKEGDHKLNFVAKDSSGNIKTQNYSIRIDTTAPTLVSLEPKANAVKVPLKNPISAQFTENLAAGKIAVAGSAINGVSTVTATTVRFNHNDMEVDGAYTATVSEVKDTCGNSGTTQTWDFTTGTFYARITSPPISSEWSKQENLIVKGEIRNPTSTASVSVSVDFSGESQSKNTPVPLGEKNIWTLNFPMGTKEGIAAIKMTAHYKGDVMIGTRAASIDNKPPVVTISSPIDGQTVSAAKIPGKSIVTDLGSKIETLAFAAITPPKIENNQAAATISGDITDLKFGENELTASASDRVGNKTSKKIIVIQSGHASWSGPQRTAYVACEGPAAWDAIVTGTPGLKVLMTFQPPRGNPRRSTGVIGNDKLFKASYSGKDPGDYEFTARVTRPTTGEVVFSATGSDKISACFKDPTFVVDSGIFPPFQNDDSGNESLFVFSPNSSAAVKDTFNESYAVLYESTDIKIRVFDDQGNFIKSLLDSVQTTGQYSFTWDGTNNSGTQQPEGIYSVFIDETDLQSSAHTYTEHISVQIDNTSPTATLEHLEGTPSSPRVFTAFGSVSDKNLVSYTFYRMSGPTVTAIQTVNSSGATGKLATIDANGWEAGSYFIRVEGKDSAGNTAFSSDLPLTLSDTPRPAVHVSASIGHQGALNAGGAEQPADSPEVFFDDSLPSGATPIGNWEWNPLAYSGTRSHSTTNNGPLTGAENRAHYFIHASPGYAMKSGENLVQYVFLDSNVKQILLQYYTEQGNGEHRVYWGENLYQSGGVNGSEGSLRAGDLPPANKWVRLRIPVESIGLAGKTVKGILFTAPGGKALWDKSAKSNNNLDPGGLGYTIPPLGADDSTSTDLEYSIDRNSDLRVDVIDNQGQTIKTLVNGSAGDSTCCTQGDHLVTWDQTTSAGTPAEDGTYAFRITSPSGSIDTEIFSKEPSFNPNTDAHPNPSATTVIDANGNNFSIDASSPTQLIKTNTNGLFLTSIQPAEGTLTGLSLDAGGNLFVKNSLGAVSEQSAARLPFTVNSLTALINVPWPGAMVKATVPIIGAATGKNFRDYIVDISSGWPSFSTREDGQNEWELDFAGSSWTVLTHGLSEVQNSFEFPEGEQTVYGNLATWETGLSPGEEYPEQDIFHPAGGDLYRGRWTVRLRSYSIFGATKAVAVPVIIGRVVNNATGGLIRSDDGHVRVHVPALALIEDWSVFSILRSSVAGQSPTPQIPYDPNVPAIPAGFDLVGTIYQMLPPAYSFRRPCRFEIDIPETSSETFNIALYRYDPDKARWNPVSSERVFSSTDSTESFILDSNFVSVPNERGYFALLNRNERPAPPQVFQPHSPTNNRFVSFFGLAEPAGEVAMFSLDLSTAILPVLATSDSAGNFKTPPMYLPPGSHQIAGIQGAEGQSIASGLTSDPSPTLTVEVLSRPAINVASLAFFTNEFVAEKTDNFQAEEGVYLQLTGGDPNPAKIDDAYVTVRSTATDPAGIIVRLVETGINTGIYRGSAALGSESNQSKFVLAANLSGELIEAVPEDDPSKLISRYFENTALPPVPLINSISHPSAFQDTFEVLLPGGQVYLNDWGAYDLTAGADITITTEAATGAAAIRLTQNKPDGNFSAIISSHPFNIREMPILSFDVRMQQTVRFNLFFQVKGGWLEYIVNDAGELPKAFPPSFDRLGSLLPDQRGPALNADGAWQNVTINLFNSFRKKFPQAVTEEDFTIDQIIMGDWNAAELFGMTSGNTPVGSWVEFDNAILTSAGSLDTNPFFAWTTAPTGQASAVELAGYSTLLDQNPGTIPNDFLTTQNSSARVLDVPSGFHYFHVRTKDINQNWSDANHYRVLIDTVPPQISDPAPAANTRSEILKATVHIIDPIGHGLDPDSVKFSVNGTPFDQTSQALSYDAPTGILTISLGAIKPTPPAFIDGQLITVSIIDASDWAGNHILQPFSWTWQADFSRFSGGDFAPLTLNGGRQPAWSPDGAKIAFVSDREGQTDLWVISSTDAAETGGTATRFTNDSLVESAPAWSPDGNWIVYASNLTGVNNIFVKHVVSGVTHQLTTATGGESQPAWSPDGKKIIFSRNWSGGANLYELQFDPATGNFHSEKQITLEDVGFNFEPAFTPNGQRLVYHRSLYADNIFASNSDGTNPAALTSSAKDFLPDVRPDGKSIAFMTRRTNDVPALWSMDTDGANQKPLLDNQNLWADTDPAWSPDGSRLAFSSLRSGGWNVWTLSFLTVSNYAALPKSFSPIATGTSGLVGDGSLIVRASSITYSLTGSNATVDLTILQPGKPNPVVRHLVIGGIESTGDQLHAWDGRDNAGALVPSGDYTARLTVTGPGAPESIVKDLIITVDNDTPITTIAPAAPFISTRTAVQLAAGDTLSAVKLTAYIIDGDSADRSAFTPYTEPFFLEAGTHTVSYFATDIVGNEESIHSITYGVDDVPPTISFSLQGPQFSGAGGVFISSQTAMTITGQDGAASNATVVSGIRSITTQIDADPALNQAGDTVVFNSISAADGPHTVHAQSHDAAGNSSLSVIFGVIVDTVAPTVSLNFDPPVFNNGVRDFAVPSTSITFIVSDLDATGSALGASGVGVVRLEVDETEPVELSTSAVHQLHSGDHRLTTIAFDHVGNPSPADSRQVTVTTDPPSTFLTISQPKALPFIAPATVFAINLVPGAVVDHIEVNLDNTGFTEIAAGSPFSFPAVGEHTLEFRAINLDLTPEFTESLSVITDVAAPTTTLVVSTPSFDTGEMLQLRGDSLITLSSTDSASGVGGIFFAVNGTTKNYTAPFTFRSVSNNNEGIFNFAWWSVDRVANTEMPSRRQFQVDNSTPTTTLATSGPRFNANGKVYLSSHSLITISAEDLGTHPSGIDHIQVSTAGTYFTYTGPFHLTDSGAHAIDYFAVDRAGNTESFHRFSVVVDTTPPAVAIETLGPALVEGTTTYLRSDSQLVVVAPDDLSGLAVAQRSINGGLFTNSNAPFSLPVEGINTVAARGVDNVLNELIVSGTYIQENSPPTTSLSFIGQELVRGATHFITPLTAVALQATDGLTGSGVLFTQYALNNDISLITYVSSFTLTPGLHSIRYFSTDKLASVEEANRSVIFVDGTAPQTSVDISTDTGLAHFISIDHPAGGVGMGRVEISLNGSSFTTLAATSSGNATLEVSTSLPAGESLTLLVRSFDLLGNQEPTQRFDVLIGTPAPSVQLALTGPHFLNTAGGHFGSAATRGVLSSANPAVAKILYSLDGAPFTVYANPLAFGGAGAHQLRYLGERANGQREPETVFDIFIDTRAPVLTLTLQGGQSPVSGATPFTYVAPTTAFLLTAIEVSSANAAGLLNATYRLDSNPPSVINGPVIQNFPLALSLSTFTRTLFLSASDNVLNLSSASARFRLDATPPVTSLSISSPGVVVNGQTHYPVSARFTFTATDTLSGVQGIFYAVDNATFTAYTTPFTLAPGSHVLKAYAVDKVGLVEATQTFAFVIDPPVLPVNDRQPPRTDLVVGKPSAEEPIVIISSRTKLSFKVEDDLRTYKDGKGVGVAYTEYRVDSILGGPFTRFTSSFTLSEGWRILQYRSVDLAGNQESIQTQLIRVDATAPVTRIDFLFPQVTLPNGTLLVTPETRVLINAHDPVSNAVFAGLRNTYWSVNDGPWKELNDKLIKVGGPDGNRKLSFYSDDRVLNAEAVKSVSIAVDSKAPLVKLISPSEEANGLDRVFAPGMIAVRGVVADDYLKNYTLEVAAGQTPFGGYTTLASGNTQPPPVIANWNTSKLSGFFTLRLTGTDYLNEKSVSKAVVYIGNPSLVAVYENRDSKKPVLDQPMGIAVDSHGNIYVANGGKNQIVKFSADGDLLKKIDGAVRLRDGQVITFKNPSDIALDTVNTPYVVDQNNHRLVRLDSQGKVAFSLGKTDMVGRFQPGSADGQFHFPVGVALSPQRIAVSDSANHRVQIFKPGLIFESELNINTAFPASKSSLPNGIAIGANNSVIVTDNANNRLLITDGSLKPLAAIGGTGSAAGKFNNPQGVAISPDSFIYVADSGNRRIQKLDSSYQSVMIIPNSPELEQPAGLALDKSQNLFITDPVRNRVLKYSTSGGTNRIRLKDEIRLPDFLFSGDNVLVGGGNVPPSGLSWGEVYAFPNPSNGQIPPTIHVEAAGADRVSIHIYNAAGESMGKIISDTPTTAAEATRNFSGTVYEIPISIPLPSGVYTYTVEASRGSEQQDRRGRFMVVK